MKSNFRHCVEEIELNQRKEHIDTELADIQPLIESAKKAVGQIKSDNINEIRALKMPPDAIRDVLEVGRRCKLDPSLKAHPVSKFD